jgi:hypothetical protein
VEGVARALLDHGSSSPVEVIDHRAVCRDLRESELRRLGQALAAARKRPPEISDDGLGAAGTNVNTDSTTRPLSRAEAVARDRLGACWPDWAVLGSAFPTPISDLSHTTC